MNPRATRSQVRPELTGWRDNILSARHRQWGVECPATDIDLLVEIARGVPTAIVEYKKANADLEASLQSWRAAQILADKAKLPFFLVVYHRLPAGWFFRIAKSNEIANEFLRCKMGRTAPCTMSEFVFVQMLYTLRERDTSMVRDLPIFRNRRNAQSL